MMKKRTNKGVIVLVGAALLTTAGRGLADHIPGHDDCDPTFPMPIPGKEFFTGGVLFVTLIGPLDGSIITSTSFDITYVSDGATPASDLFLHGTAQVNGKPAEFAVTGADLGFGSGPGTFTGTLKTDALNGVATAFLPPNSIVDLQIDAVSGGIKGTAFFVHSFITCDVIPPPPCGPIEVPAVSGNGLMGLVIVILAVGAAALHRPHSPQSATGR